MTTNRWMEMEKQYYMYCARRQPVVIVRGEGTRVWDVDDKEYLDFTSGWAVNNIGHSNPVVADALDSLGYPRQSPGVQLRPCTSTGLLVGRFKTTCWEDMDEADPSPYELELEAVDACQQDDGHDLNHDR